MSTALQNELVQQLESQLGDEGDAPTTAKAPGMMARASRDDVTTWYRSLSILVRAGYPLPQALERLAEATSNSDLAATTRQAGMVVSNGAPLSKALARAPWYFDGVTTGVVRAAEETASLGAALELLADGAEDDQAARAKAFEAAAYPVVVGGLSLAVVMVMLYFVAPEFMHMFETTGAELNGVAHLVMGMSAVARFPATIPGILLAMAGATFIGVRWKRRNPVQFARFISRLPIVGGMMRQVSLLRFTRILNTLTLHGVALPRALELSSGVLEDASLQKTLDEGRQAVEEGRTLAEVLRAARGLPPAFVDMMSLAEDTGRMGEVLPALSKAMYGDLNRKAGRIGVVAEPVMLVMLGGVVLVLLLGFFMPYFEVIGAASMGG
jgi:type II secretory pathway component PulF